MATFTGPPAQFLGSVFSGALTPLVATSVDALSTTYTARDADDPAFCQLFGDGNSLTYGSGVSPGNEFTQNYLAQARPLLAASQASHPSDVWGLVNGGVGSITTPMMLAAFATHVQPYYSPYRKRNVLAFLEYINDRRHTISNEAQALTNYLAYIEQATEAGWDVLLFTVPPTGPADTLALGVGINTDAINAYLRAHIAELSPFPIVDIVAAGLDDPTDTGLWNADQVHPNQAGYALFAQTFHDVIAGIAA